MLSCKGEEKLLQCSYDPAHMILNHRMQGHLVKCRRNHPEARKVLCLYNSTHQIPEPEIKFHHEYCPDRISMDKFMYSAKKEENNVDRFPIPQLNIEASENWDDECHPTYDPEEYCKNNPILRNTVINTQSAAKRRNFRMEERQRMQQFEGIQQPRNTDQRSTSEVEAGSTLRRPLGQSEGMIHSHNVDSLLTRVQMGSNVATIPTSIPYVRSAPNESTGAVPRRRLEDQVNLDSFPPLNTNTSRMPTTTKLSRGRGSKLGKK